MPSDQQISVAREDVARVRTRMSDTAAELEERLTAPVSAVKQQIAAPLSAMKEGLDVGQLVRDHPWPALAVAAGVGAALAATGADRKALSAAADASRRAATTGAASLKSATKRAASATAETARHAPSRTRGALVGALDSLAARLATSLIDHLREPAPISVSAEPSGLGYVEATTPATGVDSLAG